MAAAGRTRRRRRREHQALENQEGGVRRRGDGPCATGDPRAGRTCCGPDQHRDRKATVAAAALDAGAVIVNDVWGLRGDAGMAAVVAAHPVTGVVAMHNQHGTAYGDLMEDICLGLRESLAIAEQAGIPSAQVIIDPGFGFAKTPGLQPRIGTPARRADGDGSCRAHRSIAKVHHRHAHR